MFNKIKDLIMKKKDKKKKKISKENTPKELKASTEDLNKNSIKVYDDEIKAPKEDIKASNDKYKTNDNVVDLSKYREEKILNKTNTKTAYKIKNTNYTENDRLDITNTSLIKNILSNEKCFECNTLMDRQTKISAVSSSGKYRYVCCSNCGCIMKIDSKWNISNSKNILKEVSDAYTLFKKANISPRSYSYTKDGERHQF